MLVHTYYKQASWTLSHEFMGEAASVVRLPNNDGIELPDEVQTMG